MNKTYNTVEDGAALLDEHFGNSEWVIRIDLDSLVMSNPRKCILGQLFGRYIDGLESLGIYSHLGSEITCFGSSSSFQKQWIEYIRNRRRQLEESKVISHVVGSMQYDNIGKVFSKVYCVYRNASMVFVAPDELTVGDKIIKVFVEKV